MPDSPLIGYSFDDRIGRYRSGQTGRFVARDRILDLLDAQTTGAEQRMRALVTSAHGGELSPSVFAEQMRTELRRLHLQQSALGAGGFDRLTQRDYGRVGGILRGEYQHLEQFVRQIQAGEVTLPEALARANRYIGQARRQFYHAEADRRQPEGGMVLIEKRVLDPGARHCRDCPGYADRGWEIAGSLPVPGEACECGGHCRCRRVSREVPAGEVGEWIGTYR